MDAGNDTANTMTKNNVRMSFVSMFEQTHMVGDLDVASRDHIHALSGVDPDDFALAPDLHRSSSHVYAHHILVRRWSSEVGDPCKLLLKASDLEGFFDPFLGRR
jgi:hypothetical protein